MLKEIKLSKLKLALACLSVVLIIACGEKEPEYVRLSQSELAHLHQLQIKSKSLAMQRAEYKAEEERIKNLESNYFEKNMELKGFSFKKTSAFNDGLERGCYSGTLVNTGSELVQNVEVTFVFYSDDKKQEINRWDTSFVSANDDFLGSNADAQTKSLVLALSGKKYPMKPGESRDLSKNGNCMRDSFPNWKVDNVELQVKSVVLRPKMTKFDDLEDLKLISELASLEERAKAHSQI